MEVSLSIPDPALGGKRGKGVVASVVLNLWSKRRLGLALGERVLPECE